MAKAAKLCYNHLMSMDGLTIFAMVHELAGLIGARVDKIQQPNAETLILTFRKKRLLINIHNEHGRIHLTESSYENPDSAPAFCMLLRKHLINSKLSQIYQEGLDRIIVLTFIGRNEFFDEVELRLVVELMGRHGNAFLVDSNGKILDCMRHFGLDDAAIRLCIPNAQYRNPPSQSKLNPFTADLSKHLPCELCSTFFGISRPLARILPQDAPSLSALLLPLSMGIFTPALYSFGPAPFLLNGGERFESLSLAMDAHFARQDRALNMQRHSSQLRAAVERAHSRCANRLSDSFATIQNEDKLGQYRLYGELLTANPNCARRGSELATVLDYYQDPPKNIQIPLNPTLSVRENAARYFKKYQKSKAAVSFAKAQLDRLQAELNYLEGVALCIQNCTCTDELKEIALELEQAGYLKKTNQKQAKSVLSKPHTYYTQSGIAISVGKNNRQNDELTRCAQADEIWLHAKDIPGSHVILHTSSPTDQDILDAAAYAARYSKASGSPKVAVDYTKRRNVKKPSGTPLGFVIFTNQRTIMANPSAAKV